LIPLLVPISTETYLTHDGATSISEASIASVVSKSQSTMGTSLVTLKETADTPEAMSKTPVSTVMASPDADMSASEDGFLSFEDWKKLNLQRSSEMAKGALEDQPYPQVREAPQPRGTHGDQVIDSIGDEIDIQIAASGFGKTSKERFNYASFDCAAAVLKSNLEAKGSSAILDENRDRYMLNKCGAENKHVVVELCEDILVDTVVMANLEFFSSTFKELRISVSDRYPIQERGWTALGTFLGSNTRTLQVFVVENPLIWARYLRIEFLSHYGNEFYCPLTLLRVHGTTMMEEYKNQENAKSEEQLQDVAISSRPQEHTDAKLDSETVQNHKEDNRTVTETETRTTAADASSVDIYPSASENVSEADTKDNAIKTACLESLKPTTAPSAPVPVNLTSEHAKHEAPVKPDVLTDAASPHINETNNQTISPPSSSDPPTSQIEEVSPTGSNSTTAEKSEFSAGVTSSANPATQESVYKTITKRLSLLEANATLSLQYIEEQSQLLRDVFGRMERRHGQKMESFLADLNSTLVSRLQIFV
jgi:Sad1 / UNC-like C-terminal